MNITVARPANQAQTQTEANAKARVRTEADAANPGRHRPAARNVPSLVGGVWLLVVMGALFTAISPAGAQEPAGTAGGQAGDKLAPPPPVDPPTRVIYGSDTQVRRLAALLADGDITVRQMAVGHLGQTQNDAAMAPIATAAHEDPDPGVRAHALQAAARLAGGAAARLAVERLADDHAGVRLAALDVLRQHGNQPTVSKAPRLLDDPDPAVRAGALAAMTAEQMPAPPDRLAAMLDDPDPLVRLEAARNAGHGAAVGPVPAPLRRLAEQPPGDGAPVAVVAAALESLGRYPTGENRALLTRRSGHDNPLIRRAALRAMVRAGQTDAIDTGLADPSPLVRLAAIQLAGAKRYAPAIDRLVEILPQPPADAHRAAAEALVAIGTDHVAQTVADLLGRLIQPRRLDELATRNIDTTNEILGRLASQAGLAHQRKLLTDRPISSDVLAGVARAIGLADSRAAAPELLALLKASQANARGYLRAQMNPMAVSPPYNEHVVRAAIVALGRLGVGEVRPLMRQAIAAGNSQLRLSLPAAGAAQAVSLLAETAPSDADADGQILIEILTGEGFDVISRHWACVSAGRVRYAPAEAGVRRVLTELRPSRATIHAAGWALQEITGRTPALPDPQPLAGEWLIVPVE